MNASGNFPSLTNVTAMGRVVRRLSMIECSRCDEWFYLYPQGDVRAADRAYSEWEKHDVQH